MEVGRSMERSRPCVPCRLSRMPWATVPGIMNGRILRGSDVLKVISRTSSERSVWPETR